MRIRLVLMLVPMTFALSCRSGLSTGDAPALVGVVASMTAANGDTSVMVNDLEIPTAGYSEIVLRLKGANWSATVVTVGQDGSEVAGTIADIKPGQRLEAWTTGIEDRSLPVQWTAVRVRVPR